MASRGSFTFLLLLLYPSSSFAHGIDAEKVIIFPVFLIFLIALLPDLFLLQKKFQMAFKSALFASGAMNLLAFVASIIIFPFILLLFNWLIGFRHLAILIFTSLIFLSMTLLPFIKLIVLKNRYGIEADRKFILGLTTTSLAVSLVTILSLYMLNF